MVNFFSFKRKEQVGRSRKKSKHVIFASYGSVAGHSLEPENSYSSSESQVDNNEKPGKGKKGKREQVPESCQ